MKFLEEMTDSKTPSIPRLNYLTPRGRATALNRCISSNITMVHGEDGKAAIVSKQSTFSIVNDASGSINITRIEERCHDESDFDDDDSSISSESSDGTDVSSSSSSTSTSRYASPSSEIFRVKSSYAKTSHDALRLALRKLGWNEKAKSDGSYDFYWHGIAFEDTSHQYVPDIYAINKIPGMLEILHKVQLSRILKRMQNLYTGEFDFYPTSWVIPEQFHQFIGDVSFAPKPNKNTRYTPDRKSRRPSTPRDRTFIVKPDQGRQGEGIYLVTDPRDVRAEVGSRPCIVQEYIDKPLLLDGYKFDLRVYIVIARLDPIEIYLCKEGLARLCTTPYEYPSKQNISNSFMHLTNYSLNKNSEDFVQTEASNTGSKRTMTSVEELLMKKGHDVKKMRAEIKQLAVKTVLAVLPDLMIWNHASGIPKSTRCFQILGFDIMLTSNMKAYLLEVNAVPSLRIDAEREVGPGVYETITSAVDELVKVNLIKDTLELIALGEDNIDMSLSSLTRIYPTKSPQDPPKTFREFQERIRLCDNTCQEHSMYKAKIQSQQGPRQQVDSKPTESAFRRRPAWFCNRHCPHCYVTIVKKRPPVPTIIKLNENKELYHSTSDWRFFDHYQSGAELLRSDRQPVINHIKQKMKTPLDAPHANMSPDAFEEDEPFKQCQNCGGYILDAVGPGISTQRKLLQQQNKLQNVSNQSKVVFSNFNPLATIRCGVKSPFPGLRDFKLTPAHTSLYLPTYNPGTTSRMGYLSPTNQSSSTPRSIQDHNRHKTPSYHGKRNVDDRRKENLFSGYHVMLLRRYAKVFIHFNGIKPSLTMGATSFRNMARKCNLCDQGALPSVDILYIDAIRQWQSYRASHGTPYFVQEGECKDLKTKKERLRQAAGLPFQGFIDALLRIATQRYRGETLRDKMIQLIDECERYIANAKKIEREERIKLNSKRGTLLTPWDKHTTAKHHTSVLRTRNSVTQHHQRSLRFTSQ